MTSRTDLITMITAFILLYLIWLPAGAKESAPTTNTKEPACYTGTVTDGHDEPLDNAVIKAVTSAGDIVAYCFSDRHGRFRLAVKEDKKADSIRVTLLGYESVSRPLGKPGDKGVFRLLENPKLLKEVLVTSPWVFKRGDTLVYNVDSIISKSDVAIEDVIKKIPGIYVSGTGQILYQGRPINKFYIEDADLLQGRYTLATQNIAAKDVSSVSVYENHQPIKALKDLVISEDAALNIKLKSNRLLRPTGHITLGAGGEKDRFDALGEIFGLSVSPKMQLLGTIRANNSGTDGLNLLTSHYGGLTVKTPAAASNRPSVGSQPPIAGSRYKTGNSAIASINMLVKHSPSKETKANIDVSNNNSDHSGSTVTVYRIPDAGEDRETVISDAFSSHARNSSVSAVVNYTVNDTALFLANTFSAGADYGKSLSHIFTEKAIPQHYSNTTYKAQNNLNFTLRRGSRAFNISSVTLFSTAPRARLRAFEYPLAETRDNPETLLFDQITQGYIVYNKENTSFQFGLFSSLSAGVALQFEAEYQTFRSSDRKSPGNAPVTGNDLHGTQITLSATPYLSWSSPRGSFNAKLSVPFSQQFNSYRNSPEDIDTRTTPFSPSIRLNAQWKPYKFHYLTFNASMGNSSMTGFNSFITGPLYFDYRSYGAMGSGFDSRRKTAGFGASYRYSKLLAGLNLSASYTYSRNSTDRLRTLNVSQSETVTGFSKNKSVSTGHSLGAKVSKLFRSCGISVGTDVSGSFSTATMELQGKIFQAKNRLFVISPNVIVPLVRNTLESQTSFSINGSIQTSGDAPDISTYNYSLGQTLHFTPGEKFVCSLMFQLTDSEIGPHRRKKDAFLDMNLSYRLNRGLQLGLSLENITDRRDYCLTVLSNSQSVTMNYPMRGIRALATVKFSY